MTQRCSVVLYCHTCLLVRSLEPCFRRRSLPFQRWGNWGRTADPDSDMTSLAYTLQAIWLQKCQLRLLIFVESLGRFDKGWIFPTGNHTSRNLDWNVENAWQYGNMALFWCNFPGHSAEARGFGGFLGPNGLAILKWLKQVLVGGWDHTIFDRLRWRHHKFTSHF